MELAFLLVLLMWVFHFRSSENVIPKYGLSCTCLSISWAQRNTVVTAIFSEMYFFAVLYLKHIYIICENVLYVL